MLKMITIAIALALAGDTIAAVFRLPFPGSAIGMILLTIILAVRGGVDKETARLFDFASPHFPLFFVPAAVGIVGAGDLPASAWLHVAFAIVASTAFTIAVTGLLCRYLLQLFAKPRTA